MPGTYRIVSSVRMDGQPAGEATTLLEVSASSELADTAPNPDTLARIAHFSGGQVVKPSDPATWPNESRRKASQRVTLDFWGDGLLLILLIGVLGLDWLLRLLRGYV